MERVHYLLLPIIKELGIEDGIRLSEIKKDWNNLFYEPLSSHLLPYKLSEGKLLILVDSPIWHQQVQYFKGDLVKKLCHYGVRDVRFSLGRVSTGGKSGFKIQKSKVRPFTTHERSFIEETVSPLKDEQLRGAVKKAIMKALLRGRLG